MGEIECNPPQEAIFLVDFAMFHPTATMAQGKLSKEINMLLDVEAEWNIQYLTDIASALQFLMHSWHPMQNVSSMGEIR